MLEDESGPLHARRPDAPLYAPPEAGLTRARARAANWRELATSTPGRWAVIGLFLIVLTLVTGVLAGSGTDARHSRINTLRQHSEPLANAAQGLYSSLSVADASAGAAFLSGGLQPVAMLNRYNTALGTASAALSTASIGVDLSDDAAKRLLAQISGQLPVYAGLIATANANNRAGNPVGVSYLNEASTLMQATILPQAQQLYLDQSAAVSRLATRNSTLDWAPFALAALTVLMLIYFQVRIARQSRRVFNFGLLPATLAMGVLAAWLLTAGLISSAYSHQALTASSQPMSALTSARILAQQVRTDETMSLLQRVSSTTDTSAFDGRLDEISALIAQGSRSDATAAGAEVKGWRQAHVRMQDHLANGDYAGAVAATISADPSSSGTHFIALDQRLSAQIDQLRGSGQAAVNSSYNALTLLAVGAGVLSVAAAVLIGLGLWPRLNEYQ